MNRITAGVKLLLLTSCLLASCAEEKTSWDSVETKPRSSLSGIPEMSVSLSLEDFDSISKLTDDNFTGSEVPCKSGNLAMVEAIQKLDRSMMSGNPRLQYYGVKNLRFADGDGFVVRLSYRWPEESGQPSTRLIQDYYINQRCESLVGKAQF